MRQSLLEGKFYEFVVKHLRLNFTDGRVPAWIYDALTAQDLDLVTPGFVRDESAVAAADVRITQGPRYEPLRDPAAAAAAASNSNPRAVTAEPDERGSVAMAVAAASFNADSS